MVENGEKISTSSDIIIGKYGKLKMENVKC